MAKKTYFATVKKSHQENLADHKKMMNDESISSFENPAFLFSTTYNVILAKIAKGEIDPVWLAKQELANRGLDLNGNWIGFKAAEIENFK